MTESEWGAKLTSSSQLRGEQDEREKHGSDRYPDPVYDLISVAYHALQGAETYEQYAQDAQQQGDQELADYFRKTKQQFQQSAGEAQRLLESRLQRGS